MFLTSCSVILLSHCSSFIFIEETNLAAAIGNSNLLTEAKRLGWCVFKILSCCLILLFKEEYWKMPQLYPSLQAVRMFNMI